MNRGHDECFGAFISDNFFVISRDLIRWSAEVYDPETRAWTTLETMGDKEKGKAHWHVWLFLLAARSDGM